MKAKTCSKAGCKMHSHDHLLHITHMTAKMDGVPSISTLATENPGCQTRSKVPGSICSKCYAIRSIKAYGKFMVPALQKNMVLTQRLLDPHELPLIHTELFRFESHGDIWNDTHLENLCRIAMKNPKTKFALYTKEVSKVEKFFDRRERPDNLRTVYSSMFIDKPIKAQYRHADKVFTVYSKEAQGSVKINCGERGCFKCRLCYTKNKVTHINEALK